jgi:hypothetical protein
VRLDPGDHVCAFSFGSDEPNRGAGPVPGDANLVRHIRSAGAGAVGRHVRRHRLVLDRPVIEYYEQFVDYEWQLNDFTPRYRR